MAASPDAVLRLRQARLALSRAITAAREAEAHLAAAGLLAQATADSQARHRMEGCRTRIARFRTGLSDEDTKVEQIAQQE